MRRHTFMFLVVAVMLCITADSYPRGFGRGGGFREPAYHPTPSFGHDGFRSEGGYRPDGNRSGFVPRNDPHPTPDRGWDNNNWRNNRPGLDIGDRKIDNRPIDNRNIDNRNIDNRNIDNRNIGNRDFNNNTINANVNRNVTNNISGNNINGRWRNGYYNGYHPWVHGYWRWPGRYPYWWGVGAGAGAVWLGAPSSTVVYSNPYYSSPTVINNSPYDYAQPLPAPPAQPQAAPDSYNPYDPSAAPPSDNTPAAKPSVPPEATSNFDAARASFKQGNYAAAEQQVDKAIQALPTDATLHEFRALTLFAEKKYQGAAATIHSVLASGPGWDWDTVVSLYPNADTYTKQLRALESYQKEHPKDAASSFLLAYQYLMTGYNDAATRQLENVVKNQPDDELAAQMLKSLKQGKDTAPPPAP